MFSFREKKKTWHSWYKATAAEMDKIITFLSPIEHSCISITSRLMEGSSLNANLLKQQEVYLEKKGREIVSLLMISNDSIIAPVFTSGSSALVPDELLKQSPLIKKKYLTFMGLKDDVKRLELSFKNRSKLSVDYFQLTAESAGIPGRVKKYLDHKNNAVSRSLLISRAELSDLDRLMPLRSAYEIEEVLLNKTHFSEPACRNRFKKTINKKSVFFAVLDNKPIATCCINSEGLGWYQIGGVYTIPEYRSRGISAKLMAELSQAAGTFQKNLTLFVKKNNLPALKLYSNCGFAMTEEFRITYAERI